MTREQEQWPETLPESLDMLTRLVRSIETFHDNFPEDSTGGIAEIKSYLGVMSRQLAHHACSLGGKPVDIYSAYIQGIPPQFQASYVMLLTQHSTDFTDLSEDERDHLITTYGPAH